MAAFCKLGRSFFRPPPSPPRRFITSGFQSIDRAHLIDEERLPDYQPNQFYPVNIGDLYKEKYQVVGKLGYGGNSTVWLCRDLRNHRYVTLKFYTKTPWQCDGVNIEVDVYKHLSKINVDHSGQRFVRTILDAFEVTSPCGTHHHCLVHEPLAIPLSRLQRLNSSHRLTEGLLRGFLSYILRGLDFLHTEANMIHTDIKASNILLTIEDQSILADFEKAEVDEPGARKEIDNEGRTIYTSREFHHPKVWGLPVLCDLGAVRIGKEHHEDIQPEIYRAPEVILRMRWGKAVDIWNVGVMIWDLFEDKHMFQAQDSEKRLSNPHHLAEMIAYLGPPPLEFLKRSDIRSEYFDDNGKWKGSVAVPQISLEQSEENLQGESKMLFLQFVRCMLKWLPEDRSTAKQLLGHPWMKAGRYS